MIAKENVSMLSVTPKAKEYLTSVASGGLVTLSVKGGGCSGFQYVWGLYEDDSEYTWSEPIEDVLVLDPLAEMYVLGSEVDYVTELGGSFLAVRNPTAKSSCGCGESFNL